MHALVQRTGMDEALAAWLATERDVMSWIEDEADVLDRAEFEEWEKLWEADGAYWLPQSASQTNPEDRVSLIYDDRAALTRRIDRLSGRLAYALQPAAEVSRIVGNFKISPGDDGLIEARSRFMLLLSRRGAPIVLGGRMLHRLRRRPAGFGMVLKRVDLVGANDLFQNFTVVL
jgi:ethylbenzene dioxygenase beta subunit